MDRTIFPPADRVIYAKSPLEQVVFQVRFPIDLRIASEPPAKFQELVRPLFPMLREQLVFAPVFTDQVVGDAGEFVQPSATRLWEFASVDSADVLQFGRDNVTFTTKRYESWERFNRICRVVVGALQSIYSPPLITRLGLRYQNHIDPRAIGFGAGTRWDSLLSAEILGSLADSRLGVFVESSYSNVLFKLPAADGLFRLQHGFQVRDGGVRGYVIDTDAFVERIEVSDVYDRLEQFHAYATSCFRWCISAELHGAMGPSGSGHG